MIQQRLALFATFCLDDELAGLLERYVEQSFLGCGYLCRVAQKILAVRVLTKEHLQAEANPPGKAN